MAWSATVYALPTMPGWLLFRFYCESSAFLDIEAGCHLNVLRLDRQLPSGLGREKDVASSGECLAVSTAGSDVFAASLDVYRPHR